MIKTYSAIKFEKINGGFAHNLSADFACFALWKSARPSRKRIRELLSSRFEILLETEIIWSDQYFHQNANRLYEAPIFKDTKIDSPSLHADKIGDNRFTLFVVMDRSPRYTYAMSVSKKIEMSNLNVVEAKYKMREWIRERSGTNYGVHSTNSIYEFFVQAPLLLGIKLFEELLKGKKIQNDTIKKDLEGAGGWNDYTEVFKILNLSSNYMVQRSFETLPEENNEKDLDLLTDNYQRLASVLGVRQSLKRPYKGDLIINNEKISVDMRFVGDKYYDVSWEKDMLQNKVFNRGVYIPREDDYFFSLLFHCKVQKDKIKDKYYSILDKLAENLQFHWYQTALLDDDEAIGRILNGYFQSQGYYYEIPLDEGVYRNKSVTKYLQKSNLISPRKIMMQNLKDNAKRVLPNQFVEVVKKVLKK